MEEAKKWDHTAEGRALPFAISYSSSRPLTGLHRHLRLLRLRLARGLPLTAAATPARRVKPPDLTAPDAQTEPTPADLRPAMDPGAGGGGVTAIRVPYRHLRDAEMELVSLNGSPRDGEDGPPKDPARNGDGAHQPAASAGTSRTKIVLACMVAAGVQFGWALQLSLLTPYIQTLGIDHAMASFIWLCGPITGFVVQPCVGVWSDKCRSKYGRRRPFILAGCLMICAAVTLIGFSADLGYILGDTTEHCRTYKGSRYRAAIVFILGFWMLDLANNTVQGPARALLADLSGPDQCNSANAIFCSWMAVGNILGFSAGASGNWHKWFPFLTTRACCEACGNLKAAFLVAVLFLLFCMSVTLYFAEEVPLEPKDAQELSDSAPLLNGSRDDGRVLNEPNNERIPNGHVDGNNVSANSNTEEFTGVNSNLNRGSEEAFSDGPGAVLVNILTSMRHLPSGMHSVLLVMALTWLSWFPFFLFDTDWMGREVYHGDPNGDLSERKAYDNGVREGAFGLLLNSVVLGIGSFLIDPLCRMIGARLVWAISNFTVFICMMATTILSWISSDLYSSKLHHIIGANKTVRNSALVVFSLLGLPLSITYSVPFSVTAELTAGTGGGQGLATGVLNLAIVVPQIVVSLGAGPWDALYGGGNIPAFALASIFSLAAGVLAVLKLLKLSNSYQSAGFHGFG